MGCCTVCARDWVESRVRAAVAALALTITNCKPDCHDLTEQEWALEWNDLYVQRCQPDSNDWTPLDELKYCNSRHFNPCHARACLDAWTESETLCDSRPYLDYEACAEAYGFIDIYCGAEE